jgi:hypothetical protein
MGTVLAVAGAVALLALALFLILRGGGPAPGPLPDLEERRAERAAEAAETIHRAEARADLEKQTDVVDWLNDWDARRRGGDGGGDTGGR